MSRLQYQQNKSIHDSFLEIAITLLILFAVYNSLIKPIAQLFLNQ